MGDNLFQNAADEGTQLGQANVKSLQTGADMMGDIFEKTADSNLKEGENQRQQQKLPYDIENIKSEVQQRLAETQLKQQQYKSAQLTAMGSAFQESTKLMNNLSTVDPAYMNTPTVENQMQRIATLKSQMGIPTTLEDVKAMMKDDGLRAKMQSVGSTYIQADPKDMGDAITQAGKMGINVQDLYAEKGIEQLRKVQEDNAKNAASVEAAKARGPEVAWSPAAVKGRLEVQNAEDKTKKEIEDKKAKAIQTKIQSDFTNKTIPEQTEKISSQVKGIQEKYGQELIDSKNIQSFVKYDPSSKTGVLQVGALDSFARALSKRFTTNQADMLKTSQGAVMGIIQKIKSNVGLADENGEIKLGADSALGKIITPAQMETIGKASQMMQTNIQQQVVKEAYGPYAQYNDLKKRAEAMGVTVPDSVMDPELYNMVKQYDDQHFFDKNSGTFQKTSPAASPTQKTSGNKATAKFTLTSSEQKFKDSVKKAYPKMTDSQINSEIKKRRNK